MAASGNKGSTVTSVLAILARASAAGVVLEAYGDRIRFNASHGLPDDLRADLVAHKPEVLALLARPGGPSSERVDNRCDSPAVAADPRHSGPPIRRVGRPGWDELSRQRWGPALDDDEPGIVVDAADAARRRAAIEAGPALGSDAAEDPVPPADPAGLEALDFTAADCPAWVDDPTASVSWSAIRATVDGVRLVVGHPRHGRRAGPGLRSASESRPAPRRSR